MHGLAYDLGGDRGGGKPIPKDSWSFLFILVSWQSMQELNT
jgi:hypothetical protein